MKLRQHQIKCIDKINGHFVKDNKGLIKMFCGSGKSFIIYHTLLEHGNNLSIVVVPSINLITQFNKDYLLNNEKKKYNEEHFQKYFELLTICSKNEIDKKEKKNFNFTTDEDKILDFLQKEEDKIILITYQSLETLLNVVKENEFEIDLLCFDEAHHILGEGMKKLLFGMDENNKDIDEESDNFYENFIDTYVDKTLFFTATPKNSNGIKMYESSTEIIIDEQEYEIVDDEDSYYQEEIDCGDIIYEYTHIDGVNDNILNDFNVRVDLYTENTDKNIYEAIFRAILETGNSRVLTFHSRSETKSEMGSDVLSFCDISDEELKGIYVRVRKEFKNSKYKFTKINKTYITANSKDKSQILFDFDNCSDNEIYILASCKTIGEGVDTKNANMVVFVDPKQSYTEIVQNIGRICRKNEKTKQLATVLIPAYVDISKYQECKTVEDKDKIIRNEMSKFGDFNGILNVLSALRQEDPYIFEMCLKYSETYTEKEINDNLKKNGIVCNKKEYCKEDLFEEYKIKYDSGNSELDNFKKLSQKINKNIQVINNKVSEDDIYIDNKTKDIVIYVKKENDKYIKTDEKCNEKINKCNRNIKPFVHTNKELQILWNIEGDIDFNKKIFGGYIKATVMSNSEEKWIEILEKIKNYIDENKKRPSSTDKNKEIKKLGVWMSAQLNNFKKNIQAMKKETIKKEWNKFMSDYEKYILDDVNNWLYTLNKIKTYVNEYKKLPLQTDKNKNIKKLGGWIKTQRSNYTLKKYAMKEEAIKLQWEKFINDYSEYFSDAKSEWLNIFEKVKKYFDENHKRPSKRDDNNDIKKLALWTGRQLSNYNNKKRIMKDNVIKNEWEKFMNNNARYFLDDKTEWLNTLNKVKKYIDANNKRPSSHENDNDDIKKLSTWIRNQKKNFDEAKGIMKDEKINEEWKKFIIKYEEYFFDNKTEWLNTLKLVKNYIDENKKRPSVQNTNNDIRKLATWIGTQRKNYGKKNQILKEIDVRKEYEKFMNDYKEYLLDDKNKWLNSLDEAKKYIDEHKKNHQKQIVM